MTSPRFARDTPAVVDWQSPFQDLATGVSFCSRGRTITETDVVQFAALTGDYHPLHTDAVFAAEGPFGARIAHGMLTISYAVGLVPLDPRRVLALRRITDVVFKRPVHLGETIHVEGAITKLSRMSDEAGLVAFSWKILDSGGRLLTRATIEVLWAADAPPAAASEPETGAAAPADARALDDHIVFGQELHPAGSFVPVPL